MGHSSRILSIDWEVTPSQDELLRSIGEYPYILLRGGVGSGKTRGGALATVWYLQKYGYPGANFIVGAPWHKVLETTTKKALKQVYDTLEFRTGIRLLKNIRKKDNCWELTNGTEIYFYSLLDPDMLIGVNCIGFWLDEAGRCSTESVNNLTERVRPGDVPPLFLYTTTPKGMQIIYDEFEKGKELKRDHKTIVARTIDNPWLPEWYYKGLMQRFSPELAKQELEGEIIGLSTGLVYSEFDEQRNVIEVDRLPDRYEMHCAIDWSFNCPHALFILRLEKVKADIIWDEIIGYQMTTPNFLKKIAMKGYKITNFYADPSGYSRESQSGKGDIDCLKAAIRSGLFDRHEGAKQWVFATRIPKRRSKENRVMLVKGKLLDHQERPHLFINAKNIRKYGDGKRGVWIDFQSLRWKVNPRTQEDFSDMIDKDDVHDHSMDCVEFYYCNREQPIVTDFHEAAQGRQDKSLMDDIDRAARDYERQGRRRRVA